METYIFIALLCISFVFIAKVLYFEKAEKKAANSRKPLAIHVPADPKSRMESEF